MANLSVKNDFILASYSQIIRLAMTAAPLPPKIQSPEYNSKNLNTVINGAPSPRNIPRSTADTSALLNMSTEHVLSNGTASNGIEYDQLNTSMPLIQFGSGKGGQGPLPPPPPLPQSHKPFGWNGNQQQKHNIQQQPDEKVYHQLPPAPFATTTSNLNNNHAVQKEDGEEAMPNDSLYNGGHQQQKMLHPAQQNTTTGILKLPSCFGLT